MNNVKTQTLSNANNQCKNPVAIITTSLVTYDEKCHHWNHPKKMASVDKQYLGDKPLAIFFDSNCGVIRNREEPGINKNLHHYVEESSKTQNNQTRGQSNLTKSASRGGAFPGQGSPRGSKVVPLNSWGRVSYQCSRPGCTVWPQCTRVTTNQRPTTSRHSLSQ